MIKILLLSNMYPSKKYPHYGVFVKNIVDTISDENTSVKVVSMPKHDILFFKVFSYVTFYLQAIFLGLFGDFDYVYGHYISHVSVPVRIIRKLNKKIKIVLNVHGNDIVIEEEWMYKNRIRSKLVLPCADVVVSPSKYYQNVLVSEYNVDQSKIVIYPSGGIDTNLFKVKDKKLSKERFGLEENVDYIGFVSRIEAHKGWDVFVEMASQLVNRSDNRKFIMVGNGDQDDDLDKLIEKYELVDKIIRIPFLNHDDLSYLFSCLDMFVFPTYRKSESLGLIGLEAMACEAIVIAANNFGPTSYIDSNINGYLFESKNVLELVQVINMVDNLDDGQKKMVRTNALNTALLYNKEAVAPIIKNIFK